MLKTISLAALALGLGACVSTTPPQYLAAPADPSVRVQDPRYATVTSGVKNFQVTGPKDWRELNRAVGPQPSGQNGGQ